MPQPTTIGILGAGAWGTALASLVANANPAPNAYRDTYIWAREADTAEQINTAHENKNFLPNIKLPPNLKATTDTAALAQADAILMVVPAQFARAVLADFIPSLNPNASLILCAKGIERESGLFMSQMAADYIAPDRLAVLSGPSFAADVANGLPTAVTLACTDATRAKRITDALARPSFRPYLSQDLLGAEIGGVVKNVLAIACGIAIGKGFGDSARAALTARGFAEMCRLGASLGASPQTLSGLAGLGDLILTCASTQSRNFSLGIALGEGQSIDAILQTRASVCEGAMSAKTLCDLARKNNVAMPICFAVQSIIDGTADIDQSIGDLLARPLTAEHDNS